MVDWSVGVGVKRAAEIVALTRHLNNYYAQTVLVSHVLTRWDPLPRAPIVSNMRTAVRGSPRCVLESHGHCDMSEGEATRLVRRGTVQRTDDGVWVLANIGHAHVGGRTMPVAFYSPSTTLGQRSERA